MFKKSFTALFLCVVILFSSVGIVSADNDDIRLSAKSAVAYSPLTGETVYDKNSHDRLPMASTTKIMTAVITCEKLSLDDEVTFTDSDMTEGSSSGLKVGDTVSVRDLVYCMLLPSGNDAANAAARAVSSNIADFAVLMNEKAEALGMDDTHFVTPSGLDAEGHYSSAYDLALLAAYALRNSFLSEVFSSETYTVVTKQGIKYYLTNHNRLLKSIDGCCGVKTGFTKKSGRCLVSATQRDGLLLIVVTLNAPDDWTDHKKVIELAFSSVKTLKIQKAETVVKVTGSDVSSINAQVVTGEIKTFNDISSSVEFRITAPKFLYAPVDETTVCGYEDVIYNGRIIYKSEMRATTPANIKTHYDIENKHKIKLSDRIAEIFKRLQR